MRSPNKGNKELILVASKTTHLEIKPKRGGNPAKDISITITEKRLIRWAGISLASLLALAAFKLHIAKKMVSEIKM